ncbi:hypothetical protein [Nevskia ramosa]|uniref:hypothetical protein n=1 Tax=Nevskia ramosa TaxID=64002 RepID=UPI003D0EF098
MKAHKITMYVVDFDGLGDEGVRDVFEEVRYPNDCLYPKIAAIETRDIGDWSDDHPLNRTDSADAEWNRLFGVSS